MTRIVWRTIGPRAAHGVGAIALALGLAGCATTGTLSAAPQVRDSVLFVSARARVDAHDSHLLADTLQFGVAVISRPPSARADSQDAPLGTVVDSVVLTEAQFIALLQERSRRRPPPYDFAVLYVHGFGTSLHESWRYTAAAEKQARSGVPWIAFCWPSHGAAITWPRNGTLVLGAYKQDSALAQASRPHFLHALAAVNSAIGRARTVVVTHSLGAQVAGAALAHDSAGSASAPLRAIAFMVPDIEATYFGDSLVVPLTARSERVLLYTSGNDRALTLGYLADGFERAGRRTDPPLTRPGLEVVDVTDGIAREGWFQRAFGTHHAVHRKTSMLQDVVHIVGAQRAGECRREMRTGLLDGATWRLTAVPMPSEDSLATCARHVKETPP